MNPSHYPLPYNNNGSRSNRDASNLRGADESKQNLAAISAQQFTSMHSQAHSQQQHRPLPEQNVLRQAHPSAPPGSAGSYFNYGAHMYVPSIPTIHSHHSSNASSVPISKSSLPTEAMQHPATVDMQMRQGFAPLDNTQVAPFGRGMTSSGSANSFSGFDEGLDDLMIIQESEDDELPISFERGIQRSQHMPPSNSASRMPIGSSSSSSSSSSTTSSAPSSSPSRPSQAGTMPSTYASHTSTNSPPQGARPQQLRPAPSSSSSSSHENEGSSPTGETASDTNRQSPTSGEPLRAKRGATQIASTSSPETDSSLSFDQVYDLLVAASQGQLAADIPTRPQASPICTDTPCFFVQNTANLLTEAERQESLGSPELLVGVKYQSFSNGEIWWSPKSDYLCGVVARKMSRRVRSYKTGSNQSPSHGYTGRWFNLIRRPDVDTEVKKSNCRLYVVPDIPSLVHFWPLAQHPDNKRAKSELESGSTEGAGTESRSSESRPPSGRTTPVDAPASYKSREGVSPHAETTNRPGPASPGTDSMGSRDANPQTKSGGNLLSYVYSKDSGAPDDIVHVNGGLQVHGDAVFKSDLWVRNLHVMGTLTVEGGINGQLVTPPEAADYAEWFEKLNPDELIEPGDVVQLRSPEQKITRDTSGLGPFLVVSTAPSVAAGVPLGASRAKGLLCGFLGQVPIKVHGPIKCGDMLVPSGEGNGYAVRGRVFHATNYEPLATAMEACGAGRHLVLSFVRWPHDTKWNEYRDEDKQQLASIERVWDKTFVMVILFLFKIFALATGIYHPQFDMTVYMSIFSIEITLTMWSLIHFPNYYEFAWEGKIFEFAMFSKLVGCVFLMYGLFGAGDAAEQNRALTKRDIRNVLVDTAFLCYEIFAAWMSMGVMGQTRRALSERFAHTDPEVNYESDFERRKRVLFANLQSLWQSTIGEVPVDASTHCNPRCGERATKRMVTAQKTVKFVESTLGLDGYPAAVDRSHSAIIAKLKREYPDDEDYKKRK